MGTHYVYRPEGGTSRNRSAPGNNVRFTPRTYRSKALKRFISGKRNGAKTRRHGWQEHLPNA